MARRKKASSRRTRGKKQVDQQRLIQPELQWQR